jgi:hypothetical protein
MRWGLVIDNLPLKSTMVVVNQTLASIIENRNRKTMTGGSFFGLDSIRRRRRPGNNAAGESRALRLVHGLAEQNRGLLPDARQEAVGELAKQPGEVQFEAHVLFVDLHGARDRLTDGPDSKREHIVGPALLFHGEHTAKVTTDVAEAGLQAARCFRLTQVVGDGDNKRRAQWNLLFDGRL